ncbi:hypothetical protein GGI59_000144 [Rhizobium lentis]|uniref:Uncharacterized protein n=1 Tax=Rhizobium lentis TaxID=1138194 RepID=A0A7W8UIA6_9HYPH|nr:hypothetical protein [Rhizobium lentis]MBB5547990.1 hypothetical protein [Rhizobium lentis]MBB5558517.1 hypothetical protein [Rhizobium lentis]MBB5565959.1 hypothetical protein [Rhizobium lentis]
MFAWGFVLLALPDSHDCDRCGKLAIYIAGVERWTAPLALRIPLLVITTIFCVSVGLVFYFCVEKKIAQFLKRLERGRRAASYMPAE